MTDLIRVLAVWARVTFGPRDGGQHRARRAVRAHQPVMNGPAVPMAAERRGGSPAGLPEVRSPYGLDEPLDGGAAALVRPYLIEHERRRERARQQRRRLTLVLAVDFGIDLDAHVVGAEGAR
ncbi:hypothetical protein QCN29_13325 [Streptomyces sp. HNM0663]|uniref:Uncharacterized protein n=1 Tax=Streptomyces chengmaiensis TaxID=3040919 RepID=A0ABT6HLZ9_9ACTN|nr:hypothetical protein [Streptomyces chengmaiensis]MDH2389758.1 hypothetical protein [Streptomyces chengmaiensis]